MIAAVERPSVKFNGRLSVGIDNKLYVSKAFQDKPTHGFTPVGESLFFVILDNAFPSEPIQGRPDKEPAFFWCWLQGDGRYLAS